MDKVLTALKRPAAWQMMSALATSTSKELELVTTRSKIQLSVDKRPLFESSQSEAFAEARLDMELLKACGLIMPLRRNSQSGSAAREDIVYSLTPRGHQVAKLMRDQQITK